MTSTSKYHGNDCPPTQILEHFAKELEFSNQPAKKKFSTLSTTVMAGRLQFGEVEPGHLKRREDQLPSFRVIEQTS